MRRLRLGTPTAIACDGEPSSTLPAPQADQSGIGRDAVPRNRLSGPIWRRAKGAEPREAPSILLTPSSGLPTSGEMAPDRRSHGERFQKAGRREGTSPRAGAPNYRSVSVQGMAARPMERRFVPFVPDSPQQSIRSRHAGLMSVRR